MVYVADWKLRAIAKGIQGEAWRAMR